MHPDSSLLRSLTAPDGSLRRHEKKSKDQSLQTGRRRRRLHRKTRQVQLEQLEARRVMASAILEGVSLPIHDHGVEQLVAQIARPLTAEGEAAQSQTFYYSPSVAGYVQNSNHSKLFVDDSDIVKLTVYSAHNWTHEIYFDGSDVGLSSDGENVDAFAIRADGSFLFSTVGKASVTGVTAESEDIILFRPTRLGSQTAGTWEMFFDGSDVGLSNWESLDGISELPDGRLILSAQRSAQVPGVSGTIEPEDLLAFQPITTGSHTTGNWSKYFDGSDVHLGGLLENIDGVSVEDNGTTIHLSTTSLFWVPGLLGFGRDIFTFEATQLGSTTRGSFDTPLTLNGSHRGLLFNSINAIHVPSQSVAGQPPVITAIGSTSIPELAPYSLQLSATDPDTPTSQLMWSLISGPTGASLNATGQFAWTPSESQGPGNFPVIVSVTDGSRSAQASFTISVTEVNQPPVIAPIASPTIEESTTYSVLFSASDPDLPAQTLTWSLISGPAGAVLNPTTGRFAWRPIESQGPGVFPIVVAVSDGSLSTQATFTLTVTEVNQPPVIAPIASRTIEENSTYTDQFSASDPDVPGQTLTWSLVSAPTGAVLNPTTGQFAWQPLESQGPGVFPIVVAVSDGSLSTQATFTLTVTEVNQAPVIAPIASRTIEESATYSAQLSASDADVPAQTFSWSLVSGPAGAVLNPAGRFAWRPVESQGPGVFPIVVAVSDGVASTQATFTLTVTEVNQPPVLAPIADRTINNNQTLSLSAVASDPDLPANILTYSLVTAPTSATIDPQTGQITWLANQTGTVPFTVQVTDQGGLSATQSFQVNVIGLELRELDRFATEFVQTLTLPNTTSALRIDFETPVFDGSSQRDIRDAFEIELMDLSGNPLVLPYTSGTEASFNWSEGLAPRQAEGVTASNGGPGGALSVTVNLSGLAAGTQFQMRLRLVNNDSDNGTVVRINSFDFITATSALPAGTAFASEVTPSGPVDFDSLQDVTGSFVVHYGRTSLAGANDRLLVDVQLQNEGAQTFRDPVLLVIKNLSSLDANALRPDGLTPAGYPYFRMAVTDGTLSTGQISLARQIGFLNTINERFDYEVQILSAINTAPGNFVSTPLTNIEAGTVYRYTAKANDADGDTLTYSIVSGPRTAAIAPLTGLLTWNTTSADIGSHRITIRAGDSFGAFSEQSFDLQVFVTLQNRPPLFVSAPVTDAIASSGFEISTVATGNQPAGVSVISGIQGPRLVSINAGDQSVSVHAGENNDRFDDTTVYSTGEPKPTGAVIDVGYTVDVGLPPFLVPADRNEVLGMDQGDFNGDGILDLAVITARFESTKSGSERNKIEITRMLGDGDGNFGLPLVIATIPSNTFTNSLERAKNLRIADIDGDGRQDVVALQEVPSNLVTIRGLGDGSFQPAVFTTLSTALRDYRLVDLDQDGSLDIVGRNSTVVDLGWMRGAGDGTFAPFVRLAAGGGTGLGNNHSRPYDFADIDNDGDVDIVHSEANSGNILILVNDGSENFAIGATIDPPGGSGGTNDGSYVVYVADFTGDNNLDIFAISSAQRRIDLFAGNGTGLSYTHQIGGDAFRHSGNLAGSDSPVDVDNDGDLDIILANNFSTEPISPQVHINDGTGRFQRTDYPVADFPGHILATANTNRDTTLGAMFGDYNRDGVVDFSYMTRSWNLGYDFNGVGIRLGTRPGEFGATRTVSGLTLNSSDEEVHAADFNGDGKVDLLALRSARMSLGNGDGTFQPSFPATSISGGADSGAVADFNLDGTLDYVATRGTGSNIAKIYVALGNGDGTFDSTLGPVAPAIFYSYDDIRTADFNSDGYPDLITKAGIERFVDVYLNDPVNPGTFTRSFRAEIEVNGTLTQGFNYTIATGDFDNDGETDFVTVDQVPGQTLKLQTFSGDSAGNFAVIKESFAYDDAMFSEFDFYYPEVLDSGDVNGDGNLDVVSFSRYGFIIHIGDGTGAFTSVDHYPIERQNALAKSSKLIDFDQDGHLDLVNHGSDETVSIRLGKGDGTFLEPLRVGTHGTGDTLTFADFDNDGHLDMATVMGQSGNYQNGDVVFYYGTRNGLVDQLAVDLDGDGNEEILAVNEANDRLKILTGDNLDRLSRRNDLLTGRAPQAVATGDLNGDGHLEIITANRAGRSISVFRGSLTTGYTSTEISVGSGPIDVLSRDINGDGHTDVLVLDDVANALWVLSGTASGTLSSPFAIALGDKPSKFTVADATGDGVLDAVITLPDSNRLMILRSIGFQPVSAPIYVSLTSSPSDIQVTDLNADGYPDLAATLPDSNVLSVLYGRGNNQFARAQSISVGKEPTRVTLADADEDGRMDLIVANTGDNTASVIYNRFDPNDVYRYDSDAIDPDNDSLTYAIVDGPGGLIINSQTGALLWAASPDQVGEHTVTIAANDGRGGIATQSFKIDVQPARDNALPLIATEPSTKIGAGESFTYQANALDNDRDTLRYSLINAPAGATIDPTTGKVTWDARADMALSFAPHGIGSGGRVEIEAHPSLQPTSLTAEGWYNFTSLPASNGRSNIITSGPATTTGTTYTLYNSANTSLRLEIDYPSPTATFTYSIPYVPTTNRWTHFAITIDDATRVAKIYVDGVERGSTTIPSPLVYNPTANTFVGDSGLFFTRAIIDNYRLWNVVRTPAEIAEGLSRQYSGDNRIVLDYRFDEPQTLTVRDFSPAGNHGYRKANGLLPMFVPGLAETGSHQFTIGVEDGRGGSDQQSFTLDILPELRGSIRGQAFSDLDNSGTRNGTEPVLAGVHLFIDSNGNGYPDPSESQTTTDASGNYLFSGLLPGQYAVRVSPLAGFETPALGNVTVSANTNSVVDLAMEQLALGQIRGQLRTESLAPIGYWSVYADLDNDSQRDPTEPTTTSDRSGNYSLSGLTAGNYTIRAELPAGWSTAAGGNGQVVNLAANAISTGNNFTLKPNNTSVTSGLQFVTTPTLTLVARETFRYSSVAISIFNEAIRYDLSVAPEGMSIDPATGLVAWRPKIAQVGEHLVVLRATSAAGSIALQDFALNVSAPNTPPTLSTEFPATAYVGLVYAVNLSAQDAQSQAITYSLLSGPSSATLNATTGELRWTPTLAELGNAIFSIEVRDALGSATVINATVAVINAQPSANPYQVTLPRTQVGLGQDYLARVVGKDALGRPLAWSLQSGPTGMLVSANGTINWSPGNSDLGSQSVVLQATDVAGSTSTTAFTLQVVGRPVNDPPVVSSQPLTSTSVASEYQYDVVAVDANSDPLSFELVEAPVGMSIHPTLGTIRWTPAIDQLGESDVSVLVTDPDGATATQTFKLKVSRSGGPPAITSIPPTEASVGIGYLYSIAARDAEGDPLTYRLLAAPAGMNIVSTTGVISWTPTVGQLGQQDVVIEVSDGIGGAVTQAFAIRVSSGVPNLPPVIGSSAPRFGAVGTAYAYTLQATDPELTAITYSLGQAPAGMTINASTGAIAWTPAVGQTGKFVVTLLATDAGGASAVESFELDVLAANSQPTIASTAPLDVAAGASFTYQVIGRDVDLDQLTYALTTAPAGATIDAFGKITWPTSVSLIGPHNFVVRVTDPRGGLVTQSFTLNVIEDVIAPKVSLIENLGDANRNILPWQGPFIVYARAIDNVAVASLTLTANGQSIPLDAAGTATFTFAEWGFQTINATATAIDTNGNVTTRTISFDYDAPEGWSGAGTEDIPVVTITSPTDTAAVFGRVVFTGTASSPSFGSYTLSYRRLEEVTFTQFFASTTAVVNGELGQWDTTQLVNDEYVIRLEARSSTGIVNVVEQKVGVSGNLKLGNFNLSFTDMVVPVSGIPIAVTRIYDSLQADSTDDFGYGWRLEYRNTDLRVGLPKSGLEDIGIYSPLRPGVKVYLNVPGQGRQGFTFDPDIRVLPGFAGNNLTLGRPRFTPDPGVTSSLSTGTSGYLQVNEFGELFAPGNIPYNPASPDFGGAYILTTREGVVYRVNGADGKLDSATDANGNRITFTDSGIFGDTTSNIQIQRDARGRISSITDPDGQAVRYAYSASGDLISVTDRNNNIATYQYDPARPHYLSAVLDPLGNTGIRGEYDSQNRLVSLTDSSGNRLNITTQLDNNSQLVVDDLGNATLYVYDNRGNTSAVTNALGNTTTTNYDARNNLLSETDALGRETRYTYDTFGNILTFTNADGGITRYSYVNAARGLVGSVIDPLGNTTTYTYDAAGNQLSVVDSSGAAAISTYDARGNRTRFDNPVSGTTTTTYDANGNVASETNALGQQKSFVTNRRGQVTSRSWTQTIAGTPTTLTESFEYDANGNLIRQTDALGNVTQFTYDANDRKTSSTDALGRTTRYNYNSRGLLVEIVHPDATPATLADNPRELFEYDVLGRRVASTDEVGRTSRTVYDAVGQAIGELFPDDTPANQADNPRTTFQYDAAGQLIATIDANGSRTEYEYDQLGNRVLTRDALGNETRVQFDAQGRRTRSIDALGQATQYFYDATGRLVETLAADGSRTRQTYAANGLLTAQIDAKGLATVLEYDALGRVARTVDAVGAVSEFTYDQRGNLVTVRDANGRVTTYQYDALSRRISEQKPLGQSDLKSFDAVGNLTAYTDFNGAEHTYSYDARNQMTRKSIAGQTDVVKTYLANGLLATETDARGTTVYNYDSRNRLISRIDPDGTTLSYTYDAVGNRTTLTSIAGTSSYEFDALNRLQSVTDSNAAETTYTYDNLGRVIRTDFANGVVEQRDYDTAHRVVRIETLRGATTLERLLYTYDANGNRTAETDLAGRRSEYVYDAEDRLIRASQFDAGSALANRVTSYSLDSTGNRLLREDSAEGMTSYVYDTNDRLLSETTGGVTTNYTYDASGNLLSKTRGAAVTRYQYTGENRLLSADTDGNGVAEVVYQYDSQGNRVARTENGVTVRYQVDTNRALSEALVEYVSGTGVVASYTIGHKLISQQRGATTAYYHADALGSTRRLTDQTGNEVKSYSYDAFGQVESETGSFTNEFLYAGQRRDPTTQLDYLRARNYDAATGRFTSIDPFDGNLFSGITRHDYVYGNANPLKFVDPTGRFSITEFTFVNNTLLDIQKAFISEGFAALKRVGRIADKLLLPGTTMMNVGMDLIASNSPSSVYGFNMYMIGTQMRVAGLKFVGLSIGAIYINTARAATTIEGEVGPIKLELSLLGDLFETDIDVDGPLDEFIASTDSLLSVNGLSEYIVRGSGPFESGLETFLGAAEKVLDL